MQGYRVPVADGGVGWAVGELSGEMLGRCLGCMWHREHKFALVRSFVVLLAEPTLPTDGSVARPCS